MPRSAGRIFRRAVVGAVTLASLAIVTLASECPVLPELTLNSAFFDLADVSLESRMAGGLTPAREIEAGIQTLPLYLTEDSGFRIGDFDVRFEYVGTPAYFKLEDDSFGLEHPGVFGLWLDRVRFDSHNVADFRGVELFGGAFATPLPGGDFPTVIVEGFDNGTLVGARTFPVVKADQRMRADFGFKVDQIKIFLNGGAMSFRGGEIFGDTSGGSHP